MTVQKSSKAHVAKPRASLAGHEVAARPRRPGAAVNGPCAALIPFVLKAAEHALPSLSLVHLMYTVESLNALLLPREAAAQPKEAEALAMLQAVGWEAGAQA